MPLISFLKSLVPPPKAVFEGALLGFFAGNAIQAFSERDVGFGILFSFFTLSAFRKEYLESFGAVLLRWKQALEEKQRRKKD